MENVQYRQKLILHRSLLQLSFLRKRSGQIDAEISVRNTVMIIDRLQPQSLHMVGRETLVQKMSSTP